MADESAPPFTPDVVGAILRHMNDDHPADCLRIVQGLAGVHATAATMTGLDADNAFFRAETSDGFTEVDIPWSEHLTERAQVRVEVVRMHEEACKALGIEVASSEGH
jgi:hypothetical protein